MIKIEELLKEELDVFYSLLNGTLNEIDIILRVSQDSNLFFKLKSVYEIYKLSNELGKKDKGTEFAQILFDCVPKLEGKYKIIKTLICDERIKKLKPNHRITIGDSFIISFIDSCNRGSWDFAESSILDKSFEIFDLGLRAIIDKIGVNGFMDHVNKLHYKSNMPEFYEKRKYSRIKKFISKLPEKDKASCLELANQLLRGEILRSEIEF